MTGLKEKTPAAEHKGYNLPTQEVMGSLYMMDFIRGVVYACEQDRSYAFDFIHDKTIRRAYVEAIVVSNWKEWDFIQPFMRDEMWAYLSQVTHAMCMNLLDHKKRTDWSNYKEKLWKKQNGRDAADGHPCNIDDLQFDHKIPFQFVGENMGRDNLQLLTPHNNNIKGGTCYNAWPFLW